jgi:hypothetical protein
MAERWASRNISWTGQTDAPPGPGGPPLKTHLHISHDRKPASVSLSWDERAPIMWACRANLLLSHVTVCLLAASATMITAVVLTHHAGQPGTHRGNTLTGSLLIIGFAVLFIPASASCIASTRGGWCSVTLQGCCCTSDR